MESLSCYWDNGSNCAGVDVYDATPLRLNDDFYAKTNGGVTTGFENLSGFGLAVPPTATITGIAVEIVGRSSASTVNFNVNLSWGNGVGGTWTTTYPASPTRALTTTETTLTLGDPSFTWGHTWTRAELSTFWLRITKTGTTSNEIWIDQLRVAVYYSMPAMPTGDMQVRSGRFTGDGVSNRAIAVGFQPHVVFVKAATAQWGVVTTSTMSADSTKSLNSGGEIPFAGGVKSLTATGFTLGTDARVNGNGTVYYWVAFRGAVGQMVVGAYSGNTTDDRSITGVGFKPDYVIVLGEGGFGYMPVSRSSTMTGDVSHDFDSGNNTDRVQAMEADGFQVGASQSVNLGGIYHYIAWKATPGRVAVGSYAGNSTAGRTIDSVGFRPEWQLVKYGTSGSRWVHRPGASEAYGDYSLYFYPQIYAADRISALRARGFEVGADGEVNGTGGSVYHWISFGQPPPAAEFVVKSGSYVGNATGPRAVEIGFQPDVVIVDNAGGGTSSDNAVIATSTMGGLAKQLDTSSAATTGVVALTSTGISVGAAPEVNGSGSTLHYVAFKAAAGSLAVGSYTGNGSAQAITGVGFAPAYVIVVPESGQLPLQYLEGMGSRSFSLSFYASGILGLDSDGFRVGSATQANASGVKYHWVAWGGSSGQVTVGSYAGDGAISRSIGRTGFIPEWVVVSSNLSYGPRHKPASTGVNSSSSLLFTFRGVETDAIVRLTKTGFDVAWNCGVNGNPSGGGCTGVPPAVPTYYWVAFGPHTPTTNYRSIGPRADLVNSGTITVTSGSATVTKVGGTGWATDRRGRGDRFTVNGATTYTVLAVDSENQLTLSTPATASYSGPTYTIGRQYRNSTTGLQDWESCISFAAGCTFSPVSSASLVTDDRVEVGIVYDDDVALSGPLTFDGSTTDANHTITLTVDPGNRHSGVAWSGSGATPHAVVNNGSGTTPAIQVFDDHVTVEWLEIRGGSGASADLVSVNNVTAGSNRFLLRQSLLNTGTANGVNIIDADAVATLYNNMLTEVAGHGIYLSPASWAAGASIQAYNNTVAWRSNGPTRYGFQSLAAANAPVILRNNIGDNRGIASYGLGFNVAGLSPSSSNNVSSSSDTTGPSHSPAGGGASASINYALAPANLHLTSGSGGINQGADLTGLMPALDIDSQLRPASAWDVGADEYGATTAVKLAAFRARGYESAVLVEWETASELDNLGFHLYRGPSPDGPWALLNATMIPGLGSSPEGKQYRYVDSGLVNGTTYFYRLEDVDRHGGVTSHGPVSATPASGVPEPGEGGGEGGGGGEEGGGGPAEPPPSPKTKPKASWTPHGEPERQSLRVLERSTSGVTLELVTGGFYSQAQPDGTTKLIVPGFFDHSEPGRPTVPTRRLWQDALVGRGVKLVSATPSDLVSFSGLTVPLAGKPLAVATPEGTYEASALPVSRAHALSARAKDATSAGTPFPASLARVHQTAFQGERKKAYVELSPLRVNETTGRVVLARRLLVRLAFTGAVDGEHGKGSLGRRAPVPVASDAPTDTAPQVLARFATTARGLHAVSFSAIPGLTGPVAASSLRLSRLGASVPFHVEPRTASFGPSSTLYFLSDGTDSAYGKEAVYELSLGAGGLPMPVAVASARRVTTSTPLATLRHEGSFEADLNYLPALTEARDVWVWDYGLAGAQGQDYAFTAHAPSLVPETARLRVDLEGGSDTVVEPDHHVLAFVNGSLVGELRFDGMRPATLVAEVPTALLRDGANTLRLENAGDTGSTASFVYLDRFSLEYPRPLTPTAGVLEGRASQAGRASLEAAPGSILLDTTGSTPVFLGRALAGGRLAWNAEANHRYLAVLPEALLTPEVRPAPAASLRATTNQVDWIVLAPGTLLPAAEDLAAHREAQGLAAMAVSLEAVVDEFGYGEPGPHAVRDFLAFAFHRWQAPSPRYVLLLGDASYDPKGHLVGTSRPDLVPTTFTKSTFLWTPADPLYAAVNGTDALPDIAIGRINAATLAEAQAAVQKILDFENAGLTLDGKATLVADNPDQAGDFEANQDEIATLLPSRTVEKLFLTQLGATATKAAVRSAFDSGLSLMSYVGHGSSGLWATEGILRSPDIAAFAPQPQQPLVLTMTCSNGYFVSPYNNSLSERLVLAEAKGAIASFSPSGLSLNDAAHVYHRAVVSELELGSHERLGDLLLAAQAQYAASGAFPELLDFYNLLGDPGLRVR